MNFIEDYIFVLCTLNILVKELLQNTRVLSKKILINIQNIKSASFTIFSICVSECNFYNVGSKLVNNNITTWPKSYGHRQIKFIFQRFGWQKCLLFLFLVVCGQLQYKFQGHVVIQKGISTVVQH